ncbi:type 2 isopentenyl-diphosphate Delta-isomerase [Natranaerobius thermophilus]|uniref:Isopentenyl-diphosphate delta-isomerase n=1 Tax=Natranaerobius thermophilus (strain ATCC BAA-1301 / DSM 18059 / JW/NM-WN-LF) TaxID=457570 RepID=B2A4N6_NATTJ|nr:type 2 isopentenyl-diphosphate Delta-isomerase [Natranaerobius thermophilus]ACB85211.1 isopentenyl-diphosphate delta-isomerase, type 2 [Natranaerobius thermophilus JW/NM-WN-LF]
MINRSDRKSDHLHLAINQYDTQNILEDIKLLHNCLPECNYDEINLSTSLCGLNFNNPIMINAITGGTQEAYQLNKKIASVAREVNIPMAVGSQKIALEDQNYQDTFEVVRRENPRGVIFANIGAYATPQMAQQICEMIKADGLQIHLNIPQELAMGEGDRSFQGYANNIAKIIDYVDIPVIVKEVGFGVKKEEISKLMDIGVKAVDISGCGGTNFINLENSRLEQPNLPSAKDWGIDTGSSLLEAVESSYHNLDIIASGGFSRSIEITKALALGARCVALAGYPLHILWHYGQDELISQLEQLLTELRSMMLMCGATSISQLCQTPLLITGKLREHADLRGIDVKKYARR